MGDRARLQAAQEPAEAVSLRVLWFALRAPGGDPPAAPGIAYDAPRVQSTPTLHEPRLGACVVSPAQRVDARLDALVRRSKSVKDPAVIALAAPHGDLVERLLGIAKGGER